MCTHWMFNRLPAGRPKYADGGARARTETYLRGENEANDNVAGKGTPNRIALNTQRTGRDGSVLYKASPPQSPRKRPSTSRNPESVHQNGPGSTKRRRAVVELLLNPAFLLHKSEVLLSLASHGHRFAFRHCL